MIDYKDIDNKMQGKKKRIKIDFAKSRDYSHFSEMVHEKHVKDNMSGTDISRWIQNEDRKVKVTPSSIIYTLKVMGTFKHINKTKRKTYVRTKIEDKCTCCKSAHKDPGLRFLCRPCFIKNADYSQDVHTGASQYIRG